MFHIVRLHFTMYDVLYTLYNIDCTMYTAHYAIYTEFTLYTVQCTMHTIRCMVYYILLANILNVRCVVYIYTVSPYTYHLAILSPLIDAIPYYIADGIFC